MNEKSAAHAPKKRKRWFLRILGVVVILSVVLIVAAPWIVANTGLRDRAINAILASPSVSASSDGASFGWFSPLSVQGLQLKSANNRVDIQVDDITAERSPLQLWSSAPDLGTVTVNKPHVQLVLPLEVEIDRKDRLEPTFNAIVKDAALTVRLAAGDAPVIDVDAIDMSLRVEKTDDGRVLTLDPVVLFEKRQLSPSLANKLVHLIDPTLTDVPQISGQVSLALDKLRMPLGIPKDQLARRIEIEGKLRLHKVSTEVRNPLRRALVQLVADMNGKQASDVVRLVQDTEIRFQVRDGRLHHEGLRIGLPDIDPELMLTSHGSVGLDKTLDLYVDLPRLDEAKRKEKGPAKCRITGTIANPNIAVEDACLVIRQPERKEPIIAVDGINLNMHVENAGAGHVLAVEPIEVCKKAKLSLGLAGNLVQLIVPDLDKDQQVTGEVSLSFQKLRIPLGVARAELVKRLEVEGTLTLHQVVTDARSPLWQSVLKVLDDMHGKRESKVLQLAKDSEIHFQIHDGRLYHDGLRIGFPDIDPRLVVSSRGSIGMDETLDLHLELPRLDTAVRKERGPAKCHITGTIGNPKIAVEDATLVIRQPDREAPIIAVDGIHLNMHVEKAGPGYILAVEPIEVFKNAQLNLGLGTGLAQLIAPDLDKGQQLTGNMSLAFKTLRIPFGAGGEQMVQHLAADGTLQLQQVATEARTPMFQALLKLLADIHGKKASNVIRLVEDAKINFQMRNGRLYHDGLRIGLFEIDPALVVSSRGSIGTDETLDLHLEFPRLRKGKQQNTDPVRCDITGTIADPRLALFGAALVVNVAGGGKAVLTVDDLTLSLRVESGKDGRMLTLAPVTIFNKHKLTPEVSHDLLHLVAPSLADLAGVQGEFSLSLDRFRIPLGAAESDFARRVDLAGKLQLHQISLAVKTPLLTAMVKVLADMHGKKPSAVVRVVEDAEVRFEVRQGRMYHEGLRIGFPDISPNLLVSSRGSVGLDTSLDIVLEVPRVLLKDNINPAVDNTAPPVRLRVTGTIDNPMVTEIKG
jgi:hypothetical protein